MGLESVDVWFQDEARFGQQNTTTRLWAERGSRSRAVKQQQFEYAYLFGSVCPTRGLGEAMLVPWVNKDIMVEHLKQLSAVTEKGRHAVVIMDGEGLHTEDIADEYTADQRTENLAAMLQRFETTGASQIMVEPVPMSEVSKYDVVDCGGAELAPGDSFTMSRMVEKPAIDQAHRISPL